MSEPQINASVKTKFIKLFLLTGTAVILLFVGALVFVFHNNIHDNAIEHIKHIQGLYHSLEEENVKMLSAALNTFAYHEESQKIFMEHNRDKLFSECENLFTTNRNLYGITHFYFIDTNGVCFLRMHNRNLYDDLIDRKTFQRAKATNAIAVGVELGQTAYALRAVMPYFNDKNLIGYIEFGEEIDHFDNVVKKTTGSNVIVLANKTLLNKQKYMDVRTRAGRPNEWNDFKNYVVLSNTFGQQKNSTLGLFKENEIETVKEPTYIGNVYRENRTFMQGAFPFYDIVQEQTGVILVFDDITEQVYAFWINLLSMTVVGILLLGLFFILALNHLQVNIVTPLIKLTNVADMLSKGKDLDHELVTNRTDEIGMLTRAFDRMRISINKLTKRLIK